MKDKVPTFDQLMNPLLEALRSLGGSGSIDEINEPLAKRGMIYFHQKDKVTDCNY